MRFFLFFLIALGLSACVTLIEEPIHTALTVPFVSNNASQYLDSKNAPDLVVTPQLTKANLSGFYRLPPPPKNPKVEVSPPVT